MNKQPYISLRRLEGDEPAIEIQIGDTSPVTMSPEEWRSVADVIPWFIEATPKKVHLQKIKPRRKGEEDLADDQVEFLETLGECDLLRAMNAKEGLSHALISELRDEIDKFYWAEGVAQERVDELYAEETKRVEKEAKQENGEWKERVETFLAEQKKREKAEGKEDGLHKT